MIRILNIYAIFFVVFGILGCKKETPNSDKNPYTDWGYENPWEIDSLIIPEPNTLASIHYNILKPSCANSGCHDGNFEPDFRSLKSSYFSLVNQLVIKTDSNANHLYRVIPGNSDASMLIKRMKEDLNGNSGIMPLSIDPDSDWPEHKDAYIQEIVNWINNGAKDVFGNSPLPVDQRPIFKGFLVAETNQNLPLPRNGTFGPVVIPNNVNTVDIWFAFDDDFTPVNQFSVNELRFNINLQLIDSVIPVNMQIASNPITALGLNNEMVTYIHKATILKSTLGKSNDIIWFRAAVSDNQNPAYFYPAHHSLFRLKTYASVILN